MGYRRTWERYLSLFFEVPLMVVGCGLGACASLLVGRSVSMRICDLVSVSAHKGKEGACFAVVEPEFSPENNEVSQDHCVQVWVPFLVCPYVYEN